MESHFKVLQQSFYVMGKAFSGELSCMWTGLVALLKSLTVLLDIHTAVIGLILY